MTVATDPIQVAALVATLQEVTAEYDLAKVAYDTAAAAVVSAASKITAAQAAIDKCFEAMRDSNVPGTPWHRDSRRRVMKDELAKHIAAYERDRGQVSSAQNLGYVNSANQATNQLTGKGVTQAPPPQPTPWGKI